jgi:hypothetical protein
LAVAIFQLGFDGADLVFVGSLGQAAVELQALAGVGDAVVEQERRNVDGDLWIVLGASCCNEDQAQEEFAPRPVTFRHGQRVCLPCRRLPNFVI